MQNQNNCYCQVSQRNLDSLFVFLDIFQYARLVLALSDIATGGHCGVVPYALVAVIMSAKRRANPDDFAGEAKQKRTSQDFISRETAKMRKLQSQNIVNRLVDREMWGSRRAGTQIHETRRFYQNIFPNLTVVNVEKPSCYLRKFSPDGKYLIAFSLDQTSLEIYEYQGVTAGLLLTKDWMSDIIPSQVEEGSSIRNSIFDKLFKVSARTILARGTLFVHTATSDR